MLTRIKSQSDPLNVEKRLITEPSIYLQHLQQLLANKQKKLSETALQMQKSVEEIESNVQLMKQRLFTLESARKRLEEELVKNKEQLQKSLDSSKVDELENKNTELLDEKQKIEQEISQKLSQINDLETSLEMKEKKWNDNKKELIQRLKLFESQELVPYLNEIENIMQLTNSRIEASNIKLTKLMTGEMEFGLIDPFVSIGKKFQEKFQSRQDLFDQNYFGIQEGIEEGIEEGNEDGNEESQLETGQGTREHFGKEEDFEIEEIDYIDDTDSDEEDDFFYELDEDSLEG